MNNLIASIRGCTFNNKHNSEINIVMLSKSIQSPPKKKIKEIVPFMNGSYDFSSVGSNGEIVYSEREIKVVFGLPAQTKERLQVLYSDALEWLMDSGKQQLKFDVMKDYYFMAEVESTTSFEETMEFGKLEVIFIAEPFKYSVDCVGDDIWDTFNFEEDWAQETEYNVTGSKTITIYNPGRSITPLITCSANMTIIQNGKSYSLKIGDNKLYGFRLTNLANTLTINGTGQIKFTFRKERL